MVAPLHCLVVHQWSTEGQETGSGHGFVAGGTCPVVDSKGDTVVWSSLNHWAPVSGVLAFGSGTLKAITIGGGVVKGSSADSRDGSAVKVLVRGKGSQCHCCGW